MSDKANGPRTHTFYEAAWCAASDSPVEEKIVLLHEMLDAYEALFEKNGSFVLEACARLESLTNGEDPRTLLIRGRDQSQRARKLETPQFRIEGLEEAEKLLERAVDLDPSDPDAWGTLGGVRRRLADACRAGNDEEKARTYRAAAVSAYRRGCEKHDDPYTVLNFLEERAIDEPVEPILRDDDERTKLARALQVRARENRQGLDAPWPSFDLARGRFFLHGDLAALCEDLRAAVDHAKQTVPYEEARHAVTTTAESLRRLASHRVQQREELDAAALLLETLLHPGEWLSPSAFLPSSDWQRVRSELREMERRLEESNRRIWGGIQVLLADLDTQLSKAEEEKLQKELKKEGATFEPRRVKVARFLWKHGGEEATTLALCAAGIPGADMLAKILKAIADHDPRREP